MTVYGCQTQVSDALRRKRETLCSGTLCVRRNGLLYKPRKFATLEGFGPDHNLGVYNNSVDTIERALTERYFLCKDGDGFRPAFKVGPLAFKTQEFSEFLLGVNENMPRLPVMTCQEVVDTYRGPKRAVYQEALVSLSRQELTEIDAVLSMFIKFEKQDVGKAPRGINPRSTRYNLRLGKYLKHAEHHFFKAINKVYGKRTRATVIKGFNADVIAQILWEKWKLFRRPVAIGLDATKFDMHVSVQALKYEHMFYKNLFPRSEELKKLLKWQLRNRGVAHAPDGRVEFCVDGTRCSGDLNTSLGNCLLMCAMIWCYAKERGIDIELANNGDDCVVIMEADDEEAFRRDIPTWFKTRGFGMTVEPTVTEFEGIEFCQTHPVQLATGWRMVRNLRACLEKDPMCLLSIPNDTVYRKWLAAVGMCGSVLTAGVPVLSEFYSVFSRNGTTCTEGMLEKVFQNRSQLHLGRNLASSAYISPQARVSFYYAFGVLPDEQLMLERLFANTTIGTFSADPIPRDALRLIPGHNIITVQ